MPNLDWFDQRKLIEKKWSKWKKKIIVKGLPLTVTIPLDRIWAEIEGKFVLCFRDQRDGEFDVTFKKPLAKFNAASLTPFILKSQGKLPIGKCSRCSKKALVRNANDEISVLGENPSVALMCERCVQQTLIERSETDQRLHRNKLKQGYKFVLNAVFESELNGRKYYYRSFFKSKPSANHAQLEARKNQCRVVPGTVTINRTSECFAS